MYSIVAAALENKSFRNFHFRFAKQLLKESILQYLIKEEVDCLSV